MKTEPVKHKVLSESTPIAEITDRYYTAHDLAKLLNHHISTIWRHIKDGKLQATRNTGGHYRIPREEVIRLLGGEIEDKKYFQYNGIQLPHLKYVMYLLIASRNDVHYTRQRLAEYKLPIPPASAFVEIWEGIVQTATRNVAIALRAGRDATKTNSFRDWVESLGIAPLFDNLSYPCRSVLMDHSKARIAVEAMVGGRVALTEISDFMDRRFGKIYNIQQLKFFQYYFYDVLEFTNKEFLRYLKLIPDHEEAAIKRKAWDEPEAAKLQMGIPTRMDYAKAMHKLSQAAMSKLDDYIHSGRQDVQQLKDLTAIFAKTNSEVIKIEKYDAENVDNATRAAEAQADSVHIEEKHEDPVCYEDLDQPTFDSAENPGDEGDLRIG